MIKKCTKCNIEKELFDFYQDRNSFRSSCKNCDKIQKKAFYQLNKEIILQKRMTKYLVDKKPFLIATQKYQNKKIQEDLSYRLLKRLRSRTNSAIKLPGGEKAFKTLELLGCTIKDLKQYLESKFQLGMTWDNHGYGNDKWHIDHFRPCASFDLTDNEQQKICFHYTNLQPLWQQENFKKSNHWQEVA